MNREGGSSSGSNHYDGATKQLLKCLYIDYETLILVASSCLDPPLNSILLLITSAELEG